MARRNLGAFFTRCYAKGPVHALSTPLLALTLFCSHSLLLLILSILCFSVLVVTMLVTLFSVIKHHDHSSLEKEELISGLRVKRDESITIMGKCIRSTRHGGRKSRELASQP